MRDFLGSLPPSLYSQPVPDHHHYDWESHRIAVTNWAIRLVFEVGIGIRDPISFELIKTSYTNPVYVNLNRTIAIARGA